MVIFPKHLLKSFRPRAAPAKIRLKNNQSFFLKGPCLGGGWGMKKGTTVRKTF